MAGRSCEITCARDVSIQAWTSKSHAALFCFIFQLFVKLPTVSQKAKSPNGLCTYTVQHHLGYLGLLWAFYSHKSTFRLCYITYAIAQSPVIACRAKALLNYLKTQITYVTHILQKHEFLLARVFSYLLAKTCVIFQTIFSCPT